MYSSTNMDWYQKRMAKFTVPSTVLNSGTKVLFGLRLNSISSVLIQVYE